METKSNNRRSRTILLAICSFIGGIIVAVAIVFAAAAFGNYSFVNGNEYKIMSDFYSEYKDLYLVDKAVDSAFYLEKESDDPVDAACKGVVESLGDEYSSYMNANEYQNFLATATGTYSGIGITFSSDDDGNFVVISVAEGSPAEKAGIKPGDFITKVNGETYDDQDLIAADMRGEEGTDVDVSYSRDGKEKTVTITRATIEHKSVKSKVLDDGTGYIEISEFIENTSTDFTDALDKLEAKGCQKLILDLRNNGGGLVDEAVGVADEFLEEGVVTYTESKDGSKNEYKSKAGSRDMDVVVLVNENSASSSEILAGALQDNGIKLVGTKTFGKGIIQSTMELNDGSALKLTVAQYFTPNGHEVHKKGLTPDYKIEDNEKTTDVDEQLEKAEELLK